MKKFSKILALVLAFTMLMSVSAFAATLATGTNGKTIALSLAFSSDATGNTPITSVAKDAFFFIHVNFAGNSGTPYDDGGPVGMMGYDLLVQYDTEKMSFSSLMSSNSGGVSPTGNATFNTGIAYLGATNLKGFFDENSWAIYESGNLFRIRAKALVDLTEADLNAVTFVETATSSDGAKTQISNIIDQDRVQYTVTIPDVEEEKEPVAVDKPVEVAEAKTSLAASDATYENVAIWKVVYNASDIEDATKIGYKLTHADHPGVDKGADITTRISGEGNLEYVLALYGVSAEEYAKLTFAPYYTVLEVQ